MTKIFPDEVCDKIISYISCIKCNHIRSKENEFIQKHKSTGFSRVELQIQFFIEHNKIPFTLARTIEIKKQELFKILDRINGNTKEVLKSYVRKSSFRHLSMFFIRHIGNLKKNITTTMNTEKSMN